MTRKTITVRLEGRSNFHNVSPIQIRVDPENTISDHMGNFGQERKLLVLTKFQTQRIKKHFCGIRDCCCGSGPLTEYDQGQYGIFSYWLKEEDMNKNICLRCGHKWRPRIATRPVRCPVCMSPGWWRPRKGETKATQPVTKPPTPSCGCSDYQECSEAVRLWAEINRQYEVCRGKPTADYRWATYDEALEKYKQHKGPA